MAEIWKIIARAPKYKISTAGRVRRKKKLLKSSFTKKRYNTVGLMTVDGIKSFFVHILVAETFIPKIEGKPIVDHINGIRDDNRVENLRWVDSKENSKNRVFPNNKGGRSLRRVMQFSATGEHIRTFTSIKEAGTILGVADSYISKWCRGQKSQAGLILSYEDEVLSRPSDEIWKKITLDDTIYNVSSLGFIKTDGGMIIRGSKNSGYLLYNGISVHRLIALAFIPNPEGKPYVNHIDGKKANNDVRNLEWATPSQNVSHAHRTGLIKKNTKMGKRVISDKDGIETIYKSITRASLETGVHTYQISKACNEKGLTSNGIKWRFADPQDETYELSESEDEDESEKEPQRRTRSYRVKKVISTKDGIDKIYNSIVEASRETGVSSPHIIRVCKGQRLTAGGFKWRYPGPQDEPISQSNEENILDEILEEELISDDGSFEREL
jgi:hypothetical protein